MLSARPVVLVTGVGRRVGIAAGIVERLASDGWDIAMTYWLAYDDRMPWGRMPADVASVAEQARVHGGRVFAVEADLAEPEAPGQLFDAVLAELGAPSALVLCHAESVDSGILDTTVESFDRHFAVNARANWLLIREFANRFDTEPGSGRIVALTSDHTVFNLPYGASKGALDRIVISAARELSARGITANVVNPGPVDTGWMTSELATALAIQTPGGKLGTPRNTAALVAFLLSADGGWINGQLMVSDGGYSSKG